MGLHRESVSPSKTSNGATRRGFPEKEGKENYILLDDEKLECFPKRELYEKYKECMFSVNTLTTWARGWAARGWRRKTGEIANLDLVQEAYNLFLDRPSVEVKWIRAHHGSKWNEYADALASLYMENIRE